MEGLRSDSAACQYIADHLGKEIFTLIDVGCSGGIDPIWRVFGSRLIAFGFDPNISECKRLNAAETLPSVKYVPAFVGLRADDPAVNAVVDDHTFNAARGIVYLSREQSRFDKRKIHLEASRN